MSVTSHENIDNIILPLFMVVCNCIFDFFEDFKPTSEKSGILRGTERDGESRKFINDKKQKHCRAGAQSCRMVGDFINVKNTMREGISHPSHTHPLVISFSKRNDSRK